MTKEEAISKAADWWMAMIFDGVWDNGDAATEGFNAFLKSVKPGPQPDEAPQLRKAFLELLEEYPDLYCDYGNRAIDAAFRKHNLKYASNIHCPQKAGTRVYESNGGYEVEAKAGYGKSWAKL